MLLQQGGVYADLDAECRRPLDTVLTATDALVRVAPLPGATTRRHYPECYPESYPETSPTTVDHVPSFP